MASTVERVKQIIVEQLGVDESQVDDNASFVDDLGADSLDIVELVMAFRRSLRIGNSRRGRRKDRHRRRTQSLHRKQERPRSSPALAPGSICVSDATSRSHRCRLADPGGIGTEATWEGVRRARAASARITPSTPPLFSCRIAGEIQGFDPASYIEKKEIKKMGRFIQFAIAAADCAMQFSGLQVDTDEPRTVGVYIGSGIGGFEVIEREHQNFARTRPAPHLSVFHSGHHRQSGFGLRFDPQRRERPNSATATACTTSAHSIGDSFRLIQRGDADVMICGGTEACITPWASAVSRPCARFPRAMTSRSAPPARGIATATASWSAKAPASWFSKNWNMPTAGRAILAEIVGYGMSARRLPRDRAARRRRRRLPRDAQRATRRGSCSPNKSTTSMRMALPPTLGDRAETAAIKRGFGEHAYKVAVSSTKSMTGHLLGGAGGLEAGITVLAIRDQVAPPTINYETPDPECDLDYVPNQARPMRIDYALSNSFGFGGTNGALIFKRFSNDPPEFDFGRLVQAVYL